MPEEIAVLLELERLRGAIGEGFARMDGRLDGAQQRTSETEKDVDELKVALKDTARRLEALERRVWMYTGAAATLAGGGAFGLAQLMGG